MEQSKYLKRVEADHEYMRAYGMRCRFCEEMRDYDDFPVYKKTGRATITKPCQFCRADNVSKTKRYETRSCSNCDSEFPVSLLNVFGQCLICVAKNVETRENKEKILNTEECCVCKQTKALKSFSRPGVCLACERIMPIIRCRHCNVKFKKDDMMTDVSDTCIFCVVRRSEKIEIAKLTDLMKKNKGIASKVLRFINKNEKSLFA